MQSTKPFGALHSVHTRVTYPKHVPKAYASLHCACTAVLLQRSSAYPLTVIMYCSFCATSGTCTGLKNTWNRQGPCGTAMQGLCTDFYLAEGELGCVNQGTVIAGGFVQPGSCEVRRWPGGSRWHKCAFFSGWPFCCWHTNFGMLCSADVSNGPPTCMLYGVRMLG